MNLQFLSSPQDREQLQRLNGELEQVYGMWAEQAEKQGQERMPHTKDQYPSDLECLTLEIWHGYCMRPCARSSFSGG